MALLPRAFLDATSLTKFLDLEYIWTDSLCIKQDSTEDWQNESSTMCDVYSGAFVNIAASASVDSHGGLFLERNPLAVTP